MLKSSYEMGYTPKEFKKALLGQFSTNTAFTISVLGADSWNIENKADSLSIDVKIAVAEPRKIALLSLPVLNTTFDFKESSEDQRKEFMRLFFKYFHKGGG